MTNLEWLCAALAPRDLAPHPNFFDREALSGANMLASLVTFDDQTWRRASEDPRLAAQTSNPEKDVLAALHAMSPFDGQSDVSSAMELCHDLEIGQAVPVGLLTVVSLAAAERDQTVFELLGVLENRLHRVDPTPDTQVLLRAIHVQEAFRRYERGLSEDYERLQTLFSAMSDALEPHLCHTFPISNGVSWTSSVTISRVVDELASSQESLYATLQPIGSDVPYDLIRQPAPYLTLTNYRSALEAHEGLTRQLWRTGPFSNTQQIFTGDPILPPLRSALLHAELVGHNAVAKRLRRDQALLLLVSPFDHLHEDEDGPITLLRRSRDQQQLRTAISKARAEGPLAPLAADGRRIARPDLSPATLNEESLLVLTGSTELLTQEEAQYASQLSVAFVDALLDGTYLPAVRWKSPSSVELAAWRTAVISADVAGTTAQVLSSLLKRITGKAIDATLAQSLPSVLSSVDWEALPGTLADSWLDWIHAELSNGPSTDNLAMNLLEVTPWVIKNLRADVMEQVLERHPGIRSAALVIDRLRFVESAAIADRHVDRAVANLEEGLDLLRSQASRGSYSFGAYSVTGMSATAITDFGWDSLWEPLTRVLESNAVLLTQQAPAVFQFARHSHRLPSVRARRLQEIALAQVEQHHPAPMMSESTPGPPHASWVALLWALRASTRNKRLVDEYMFRLSVHSDPSSRRVAAQSLGASAVAGPQALVPLLLVQLAADSHPTVRAAAAMSLGRLLPQISRWRESAERALLTLLNDDGVLVPLAVLRGLSQAQLPPVLIGSDLAELTAQVARSHPSGIVRREAGKVMHALKATT